MALGHSNDNLVKKFVDTVPPLAILKHNFHSVLWPVLATPARFFFQTIVSVGGVRTQAFPKKGLGSRSSNYYTVADKNHGDILPKNQLQKMGFLLN